MILISLDLGQTSTSKNGKNFQDKNIQSKIDEFVKEEENVPKEPKEPKGSKGPKIHPKDPKPVLKKTLTMESLKVPPNQTDDIKDEAPKAMDAPDNSSKIPNHDKKNDRYKKYVSIFSLLFVSTAIFVMIGYYTIFKYEVEPQVNLALQNPTTYSDQYNYSANGVCPHWMIKGDGFCDDEANIELCDYDELDCCSLELDRSLCFECFCYGTNMDDIPNDDCFDIIINPVIGDGHCNPDLNKLEFYFDAGDCCKENVTREVIFHGHFIPRPCSEPDCICLPSYGYAYCIEDKLGDGICQDYNNAPQCDYDHGDCCLPRLPNFEDEKCCLCECKNCNQYWGLFSLKI